MARVLLRKARGQGLVTDYNKQSDNALKEINKLYHKLQIHIEESNHESPTHKWLCVRLALVEY